MAETIKLLIYPPPYDMSGKEKYDQHPYITYSVLPVHKIQFN